MTLDCWHRTDCVTRNSTYNNPFNISLPFTGGAGFGGTIVGAPGQPGYASFPDLQSGFDAGATRLTQYITGQTSYGTLNTIGTLGPVYAQDPNWAAAVSRISGIPIGQTLDPNNPTQMAALQRGIITQEQGAAPAQSIFSGVTLGGTGGASAGAQFSTSTGKMPPTRVLVMIRLT
jgi:hypothetical protein